MAFAQERGGEEFAHAVARGFRADKAGPQGKNIGVIVAAGKAGGQALGDERATASGVAVDGDGDADARAAHRDSALGLAGGNGARELGPEQGIIDAFGAVGAKVEDGMALLFVSHDIALAANLADRIAVFRDGRIVEIGDAAEIVRSPRHAYTRALLDAHIGIDAIRLPRRGAGPANE